MSDDSLTCQLLVIGAGMAGMTAAGRAAEMGARVIVIEKAASIGGSAALSLGYLWTATSAEQLSYKDNGDPRLHRVVTDTYPDLMRWLRRRGVHVGVPQAVFFGRGYKIDILDHLQQCAADVEKAGGRVATETHIVRLTKSDRWVAGATAGRGDGTVTIEAGHVLLATGGYQGSPDFRAQYIHAAARDMYLRSNSHSVGDGLRLGVAAGGTHAGPNPGFYGHLIASPVRLEQPADFVSFTQYQSEHAVLINEAGQRFVDESRADHENAQHTLRQPGARALLVWDEWVQHEVAAAACYRDCPGRPLRRGNCRRCKGREARAHDGTQELRRKHRLRWSGGARDASGLRCRHGRVARSDSSFAGDECAPALGAALLRSRGPPGNHLYLRRARH